MVGSNFYMRFRLSPASDNKLVDPIKEPSVETYLYTIVSDREMILMSALLLQVSESKGML